MMIQPTTSKFGRFWNAASILIAYLFCAVLVAVFIDRPNLITQFLSLLVFPVLFGALLYTAVIVVEVFTSPSREIRLRALCTVCGLGVFVLVFTKGSVIADYEFKNHRAAMESLLARLPPSSEPRSSFKGDFEVPRELADYVKVITVRRNSADETEAYFLYGYGFPVRHSFWFYNSQGHPPASGGYRRMDNQWYHVSD